MNLLAILLLGIALSLDTFAVSLTLGLLADRTTHRQKVRFLVVIGLFHFLMIVIGWFMGETVSRLIADYDHWIAFGLLLFIGGKMIQEGLSARGDSVSGSDLLSLRNTLLLGIALINFVNMLVVKTVSRKGEFAVYGCQLGNVLAAALIIGLSALVISAAGIGIGRKASSRLGAKAEVFGGLILIAIGTRILLEHLSVIG